MKIGLISDTHGLLRPEALAALAGCVQIIHAGDIGKPEILASLAEIAPLHAVRGNNDHGDWAAALPHSLDLQFEGVRLFVVHEPAHVPDDLAARGVQVVICGHSHQPLIEQRGALLHINPGSAGPRRFKLPITLGLLHLDGDQLRAELIEL
ncbi:metallophosphoesterase family protein [Pseudomonas sp. UL073]|uniref:Phosphoesterase n=1 Tax=Zestomonas insulae TaxID=2809017 RepID=A0ABS2IIB1_9GAMM|nr:metallophosphoesterase family protein [Pseudomonas insulae]MBM7062413.1 metallophosphoesterase family protein [Pseudomonas insulae]